MDIIGEKNHVKRSVSEKLKRQFGKSIETASTLQLYKAVAMTARDEIMEHWLTSVNRVTEEKKKVVYYLSMEFLTGKFLGANLTALGKYEIYRDALAELVIHLSDLEDAERARKRRSWAFGCLLSGFTGDAVASGCRLRHPL